MKIKKTKNLSVVFPLLIIAVISSFALASPSFEIDTQSEPTVSNVTVTPATQDRGSNVIISAEIEDVSGISYSRAQIKDSANTVVATVNLYDDGAHNDGASGDDVYASSWTIPASFAAGNYGVFIVASDTLDNIYQKAIADANFNVTIPIATCPDGTCDVAGGECSTCAADCSVADCCGTDVSCNAAAGEDCSNCADCGCVAPKICCSGICQAPTCFNDSDCDDSDSCTTDSCSNPGTCSASCSNLSVGCIDGDGCCPIECDSASDNDCVAVTCPDGTCDIAGGECATCAADCACLNLGDTGCDLAFKSVCCDNSTTENPLGEICDVADGNPINMDLNGKTCNFFGYTGGTLGCRWDCFNYDPSSCVGVPATCGNNTCDAGENCLNCPTECCPSECPDFCFSEGYECGTQTLCGTPTDCGSCVLPAICNASGKCISPSLSVSIQSPANGLEFTSGDLVDFSGFVLGGAPDYIYEWLSDEDLFLSNERVFSSRDLSVNNHTIILKVTDDNALVSQDSVNIIVQPASVLTARMILGELGEQTEFFQSFGYFVGSSIVSGGTGVYSYQWSSNLANIFSTDKLAVVDFSTIPAWALGAHTITLTVTDGVDTAQDTKIVNVTNETLLNILPNNGDHFIEGQDVLFAVWMTVGYNLVSAKWTSDLDGLIWNAPPFSFQKNDLSVGLHTITLELKDAMNVALGTVTVRTFQIQIDPVPAVCVPEWDCSKWSLCVLGSRTRICTDNNFCGVAVGKPAESEGCIASNITPAFDWRDNSGDWMTLIKNQGGCGSCWAFATLGAVEAKYNIQNSDLNLDENLSEQDLISCSYAGNCQGGHADLALHYLKTVGINDELCFPNQYADASCSGKCVGWQNDIWNIDESFFSKNELGQVMKDKLINDGPLIVAMNNDPLSASSWNSATRSCVDDTKLNHAVVIVGYDDIGGYWIVRNSWGVNWPNPGDGGYFEVLYGECGIESNVYCLGEVLNP